MDEDLEGGAALVAAGLADERLVVPAPAARRHGHRHLRPVATPPASGLAWITEDIKHGS